MIINWDFENLNEKSDYDFIEFKFLYVKLII